MKMRAAVPSLLILCLLLPGPGWIPAAVAQEAAAPPPAEPGGAEIDTIPSDAIVLTLRECIAMALENNLTIAVSRYEPQTTERLVTLAESEFDPTLSGSVYTSNDQSRRVNQFVGELSSDTSVTAYGSQWFDPLTIGGNYQFNVNASDDTIDTTSTLGGTSSNTGYNVDWKFTYRLPLLRNLGRQVNTFRIVVAQNTLGISESQFRQTVLDTVSIAVKAYADLNFAILQLRTARFSLKLAEDFLAQNQIKVRVGTLAPIEITQAEAQVADREELVIIFEAALGAAEDQIRQSVGMRKDSKDWDRPVRPSEPLILQEFEPDEEAALVAALEHRPDLEQARLDLASRETELRARENQRRWGLDFEGTYGNLGFDEQQYGDSFDDLMDRNQTNWSALLALVIPVGNRFALANYGAAESNLAQSQYRIQLAEQAARLEVRAAVRSVETSMKRVKAGAVNVRLQREKLAAEQKKFENGMSTSFQVLQFQDDLSNSETRENLAKVDYNKALAELERVKGTLLERFGVVLQKDAEAAGGPGPSAALRSLWRKPLDAWQDPGLRMAETASESIRLPSNFVFERGRGVTLAAPR